jgi:hypothetical protein
MDDFDAKNHIRDMHREADLQRLARLAQPSAPIKQAQLVRLVLVGSSILVLLLAFMR